MNKQKIKKKDNDAKKQKTKNDENLTTKRRNTVKC